jgi:hypothetical protein
MCSGTLDHDVKTKSPGMVGLFWTVTCGLVTTGIWKERGGVGSPFSGCVKSETGKKRPSAKIDGTRSRALRGATGVKNGGKSGRFW